MRGFLADRNGGLSFRVRKPFGSKDRAMDCHFGGRSRARLRSVALCN